MQTKLTDTERPKFRFPIGVTSFSPLWPARPDNKGRQPEVLPGDLSRFVLPGASFPGNDSHTQEDLFLSPKRKVFHLGNSITEADFAGFFRVLEVSDDEREYAVFHQESKNPRKDGYLYQVRVVTALGLRCLFDAMNGYEHHQLLGRREIPIWKSIWAFAEEERERWGTGVVHPGHPLYDLTKKVGEEQLSLDFMIESEKYGVYRLRSSVQAASK